MKLDRNQQAFFALLRAGLWEQEVQLAPYGEIDFEALLQLAEEQSVVGLIAAGIEHIVDKKPQKKDVLQFIGRTVQLEQRNQAMNYFIGVIVEKMREAGVYTLLVKGQGVAQCYERPLWRSCGDVDLLLDAENYEKAKAFLKPLATSVDEEDKQRKHLGITIDPWLVELHGTLRSGYLPKMDAMLDEVQKAVHENGRVRVWKNDAVDVLLPAADEDVIFVFTHILQHYFGGGIGLRQICDWCRLIWTYRHELDMAQLEERLRQMDMLSKWKAFAALAVDWLGMPAEAMPLYSDGKSWSRKASRILTLVLESGNFGQGRDRSYKEKYPAVIAYIISAWIYTRYNLLQFSIFPSDALKGWTSTMKKGVKAVRGRVDS